MLFLVLNAGMNFCLRGSQVHLIYTVNIWGENINILNGIRFILSNYTFILHHVLEFETKKLLAFQVSKSESYRLYSR